tara:strand:+ start:246 stop:695 length:450 start_codon:yes stop_codon:yes gene_type:complete
MKEKVIIISALTFVFATFYIGKDKILVNTSTVDKGSLLKQNTTTSKGIEIFENLSENSITDRQNIESIKAIQPNLKFYKTCNSTEDQTDKMTFNRAFKYYLDCEGENSEFNWKGKPYIAQLKKEEGKDKATPNQNNLVELKPNLAINKN